MNSIFHRVSVRSYLPQPVEDEKVQLLLRAAMAAPSAANQQPWEYYVVSDPALLAQLGEASPYAVCAKAAPLAFVACYRTDCPLPEYAPIDLSASVENLLLEADALGLGAVWLGIAPQPERMERVAEILQLPPTLKAFALIACGYPQKERPQEDRFDAAKVHYCR